MSDTELQVQARRLYALHGDADREYMDKRIRHESAGDMGSKTSKADPGAVPLAEFAADIERRRAEYEARTGRAFEIPRNSGRRRTASKRALLKAIEEAGGRW